MEDFFNKLIKDMSEFEEVDCIMLAGSQQSGFIDEHSDYDVYIYLNRELSVEKRKSVIEKYKSYAEINNQFWETEDDFIISDENKLVEIIYRDFNFIETMVGNCVEKYYASTGYTTCFWSNLMDSKILFDRRGKGREIIEKYSVEYPQELKKNIISKNYPLLMGSVASYYKQIKKAISRDDYISINHRVAAFLASYFDIIFAINEIAHPGEKKLLKFVKERCSIIPERFEEDINYITKPNWEKDKLLNKIESMTKNITVVIMEEGIKI
jgi:predicted nucleotidyltransferase